MHKPVSAVHFVVRNQRPATPLPSVKKDPGSERQTEGKRHPKNAAMSPLYSKPQGSPGIQSVCKLLSDLLGGDQPASIPDPIPPHPWIQTFTETKFLGNNSLAKEQVLFTAITIGTEGSTCFTNKWPIRIKFTLRRLKDLQVISISVFYKISIFF